MVSKKTTEQLSLISAQAIQFKDIAQTNEIILNRTLRYVTAKLLELTKKEELTKDDLIELIHDLNRVEPKKVEQKIG